VIKGEPEIPMPVQVFYAIGIFVHEGIQAFFHRKGIVGNPERIDAHGKQIAVQNLSHVFRKTRSHHQQGASVIDAKGIFGQRYFGDQFHKPVVRQVLFVQLRYRKNLVRLKKRLPTVIPFCIFAGDFTFIFIEEEGFIQEIVSRKRISVINYSDDRFIPHT
jgi:hypothetical protein